MKTKPIQDLLPLPIDPRAELLLKFFHDAIHEVVCYGTHILDWSLKNNKKSKVPLNEFAVAAPLIFRHILELLDSISVQMKEGVVSPCKIQLRAILEASLSLEYMLKDEELREQRAACFFIADHYRKLNLYRKYKAEAEDNKKHNKPKTYLSGVYDNIDFDPTIANMEDLIDQPQYTEVKKEFLRYTKQNKEFVDTGIKWYALYSGYSSLYKLSVHLEKKSLYDHLYKPWSDPVHGTNLSEGVLDKDADGFGALNQLRVLTESKYITEVTLVIACTIFEIVVRQILPKEQVNLAKWVLLFDSAHLSKVKRVRIKTDHITGKIFAIF